MKMRFNSSHLSIVFCKSFIIISLKLGSCVFLYDYNVFLMSVVPESQAEVHRYMHTIHVAAIKSPKHYLAFDNNELC